MHSQIERIGLMIQFYLIFKHGKIWAEQERYEWRKLTGFLCSISEVLSYRVREPVNAT